MKAFLLLLLPILSFSQTRFMTADDFRAAKFRGWNISLVESYSVLTGKNLSAVKATGANHARIWVHVQHDANNRYYFTSPTAIKTIDSAVKVARLQNLYLILTVEFLPRQGADDWWGNAIRKANMIKFWRDSLATRYKAEKIIAAYDLMNEPRRNTKLPGSDGEYMKLQSDLINAIRSVDSNHVIAVEVLDNQMLGRVAALPQKNLIYSPHGYSPLAITHQGVSGTTRRIYPDAEYKADYFKNVTYWNVPRAFQLKYNAVIWVGEFACVNWSPKNNQGEWTSTRWMNDAIKYMESVGWSWSVHAWREYQGWDAEVPSSWYEGKTFVNGKPTVLPGSSARTSNAPTITMLKQKFLMNKTIQ